MISRLKNAGLDDGTCELLLKLGNERVEAVDSATREWSSSWYEVNRLGGIEKVTIRGTSIPMKLASVLRESVYKDATVRTDLLRRDIFFDLTLVR